MKKSYIIASIVSLLLIVITLLIYASCRTKDDGGKQNVETVSENDSVSIIPKDMPLNISVYLDLSDRLMRDMKPNQMDRDTAIINHLVDIFIEDCRTNGKIVKSKNHFQVFFYPAPNSSQIAQLAKGLNIDLAKVDFAKKRQKLKEMKADFQTNLEQIYSEAISAKQWVGSDIWGFFSNEEVDKLCIRKGYRNILVILTDGYIYHVGNKQHVGNAYSYILPQTLAVPNSSLMVGRNDLSDLEVLILEVNPYNMQERNLMIPILENWLTEMGVDKFVVSETALPVTTEIYIDSFFED